MVALRAERNALRDNEQRLRRRAEEIRSEGERLKAFIELKERNQRAKERDGSMDVDEDGDRDGVHKSPKGKRAADGRRNRTVSMASSVGSTIHGSLSPQMIDKLQRREGAGRWTFGFIREIAAGNGDG